MNKSWMWCLCGMGLSGCADTLLIDDALYVGKGDSSDLSFTDPRLETTSEEEPVWPYPDTVEADAAAENKEEKKDPVPVVD